MTRPYVCLCAAVFSLAALTASLIYEVPAQAQVLVTAPTTPSQIPLASDDAVTQLGIVQGDVVVPFSTIETADQIGVSLHTHLLISRRAMAIAKATATATDASSLLAATLGFSPSGLPLTLAPVTAAPGVPGTTPEPAETGSGPGGSFLPADLKKAYGLPSTGGAGTIVLVGAYHFATALSDFNAYSSSTGLPTETSTNPLLNSNKVFQVVYATGRQPNTPPSTGFAVEAALDIELSHAMAPNAKIVLVEATNNSLINLLFGAVTKGNNLPGVREMSISFGSSEFSGQTIFDAAFTQPGIVYFASSGDTGGAINWPSSSPNVVGVGGTTLTTDTSQNYVSETGWSGSGGGVSAYEPKPSYQSGVTLNGTAFSNRATPDVSLVADPNTGVFVVYNGTGYIVGGTSLSSPAIAGIVNLSLTNRASTNAQLTQIYSIYNNAAAYSMNFRDITTGTAGSNSCLPGYDLVTGIGTPLGTGGF